MFNDRDGWSIVMALNDGALKSLILGNLTAAGWNVGNEHARTAELAEAIAKAVVTHIQTDAQVAVTGGSSSGSYKVI